MLALKDGFAVVVRSTNCCYLPGLLLAHVCLEALLCFCGLCHKAVIQACHLYKQLKLHLPRSSVCCCCQYISSNAMVLALARHTTAVHWRRQLDTAAAVCRTTSGATAAVAAAMCRTTPGATAAAAAMCRITPGATAAAAYALSTRCTNSSQLRKNGHKHIVAVNWFLDYQQTSQQYGSMQLLLHAGCML